MSHWQTRAKEEVAVKVIRTTDETGVVTFTAELGGLVAEFIPCVPHYQKPDIHVDEDGNPKKARVVLNND